VDQYYLLAQLPAFTVSDDRVSLPITEEYFNNLCARFLDKKSLAVMAGLSLEPPREKQPAGSAFIDEFYDKERSLRLALAQIRALRLKKKFDAGSDALPPDVVQAARTAAGMDSPLSAEQYLNRYRVSVIDNIHLADSFSTDAVFAYGLKLKLAERMKKFNAETGMASYLTIYDSILKADASGETK
jgi:hypothetical protein